jgi:hypothetical protein
MVPNNSFFQSRKPIIKLFYAAFTDKGEHRLWKSETSERPSETHGPWNNITIID